MCITNELSNPNRVPYRGRGDRRRELDSGPRGRSLVAGETARAPVEAIASRARWEVWREMANSRGLRVGTARRGGGGPQLQAHFGRGAATPSVNLLSHFKRCGAGLCASCCAGSWNDLPRPFQRLPPAVGEGRRPLKPTRGSYSAGAEPDRATSTGQRPHIASPGSTRRAHSLDLHAVTLPGIRRRSGIHATQRIGDCPRHRG